MCSISIVGNVCLSNSAIMLLLAFLCPHIPNPLGVMMLMLKGCLVQLFSSVASKKNILQAWAAAVLCSLPFPLGLLILLYNPGPPSAQFWHAFAYITLAICAVSPLSATQAAIALAVLDSRSRVLASVLGTVHLR